MLNQAIQQSGRAGVNNTTPAVDGPLPVL